MYGFRGCGLSLMMSVRRCMQWSRMKSGIADSQQISGQCRLDFTSELHTKVIAYTVVVNCACAVLQAEGVYITIYFVIILYWES